MASSVAIGCSNSSDEPSNSEPFVIVNSDGTITSNYVAFPTCIDSYPEVSRSEKNLGVQELLQSPDCEFDVSAEYVDFESDAYMRSRGKTIGLGDIPASEATFDELYANSGIKVSATFSKDGYEHAWFHDRTFTRIMGPDIRAGVWADPQETWFWYRGAEKFTIYGWTPNGVTLTGNEISPSLSFNTDSWADSQPDVMVARLEVDTHNKNGNGSILDITNPDDKYIADGINWRCLRFNHILGGIRIRIRVNDANTRVNRFDFNGVPVKIATYNMQTCSWDKTTQPQSATYGMWTSHHDYTSGTKTNLENIPITTNANEFTDILLPEQTFMIVPQTFGSGGYNTTLTIFWKGGSNSIINLNGLEIIAGVMTYIDIKPRN